MGAYWMDEGELDVINIYFKNQTQNSNLYIGLFTAPTEGSFDESLGWTDLTEATEESGGYERQILAPGSWSVDGSTVEQGYKQFDFASTETVLGYFIIDTSTGDGKLIAVEYFDQAVEVINGEYVKVKPLISVD